MSQSAIKFQKYYVTDGKVKAKVSYSDGKIYVRAADGSVTGLRDRITLYAQDYSRNLGAIFGGDYINDTDSQTDYFDQGRVRIFPESPLYPAAKERCDLISAQYLAKQAIYTAKRAAMRGEVAA